MPLAEKIRVGTSGWSYKDWTGPFYPEACTQKDRLAHYATRFDCVEVDSSFYGVPAAKTILSWAERTPAHFRFALKVPGTVTHGTARSRPILDKVLRDEDSVLPAFLENAALLGERLGPVVFQFPYFRVGTMEPGDFLDRLEKTLAGLPTEGRYVVELRNKGWIGRHYLDILSRHGVAAALIDHPYMPGPAEQLAMGMITTDFTYLRLLGDRHAIEKKTTTWGKPVEDKAPQVARWAELLREITTRHGVGRAWAFANNHFAGHSPETGAQLISQLGKLP
ncbi:MAG: DUF72 domain-containing protein [Planctomycetota bacterium]|nr:DUF72 domain-containing protein [Planctomycetota bacterium]